MNGIKMWYFVQQMQFQAEEVARVHGTATLHNHIGTASTGRGAGPRRAAHKQMNIILKQTDADIGAGFPVPIPGIKHGTQELRVQLRC